MSAVEEQLEGLDSPTSMPGLGGDSDAGVTVASDEDFDNEVGDDFREMVGDLISNFVTNPDLEKGFRWSGKTRSHYDLEDIAIRLRRRLAGTFLSLERPVGLGGLLDNAYVHENVLDKIHELGQTVDDVCNECLTAKRGSAALTKRLEKLEHSAKQLDNWVEWLRHPTIPGADGKPVPLPPGDPPVAAPEDAGAAGPSNGQALQMPAGDRMSYAAELERKQASKRQAAAEKQAAADRAMAALLEEEENEAKLRDEHNRKRESKKQRRRNRKQAAKGDAHMCEDADATLSPPAPTPSAAKCEAASKADDSVVDILDAHGERVKAKRINGGFGIPGVAPEQQTTLVVPSAFKALEGLEDDAIPAAHSKRSHKPPAQHVRRPAGPSPPEPEQLPVVVVNFIEKVKRKRLWEHNSFTNALNPVTRQHDPALRAAYSMLTKANQQAVWRCIPNATAAAPRKPGARQSPAAPASAKPPQQSPPPRPVASTAAPRGRARRTRRDSAPSWLAGFEDLSLSPDDCGAQLDVVEGSLGEEGQAEKEENMCVVCLDRKRDALLMPCRHRVLCMMCAFQVQEECSGECPYCRSAIEEVMHLQ